MDGRSFIEETIKQAVSQHNLSFKALLIAFLNIIFPLVLPIVGVSVLMLIDLWSGYQYHKRNNIPFHSKGLGHTIQKWLNFLLGIIVTTTVDLIIIENSGLTTSMILTNIYIVMQALRELKSISEHFNGLNLKRSIRALYRWLKSNNSDLYEFIDDEVQDKEKEKEEVIKNPPPPKK